MVNLKSQFASEKEAKRKFQMARDSYSFFCWLMEGICKYYPVSMCNVTRICLFIKYDIYIY